MPRHEKPVNFDPDDRNKSFLTATQKQNQCRSTALKWSRFWQTTHYNQIDLILHWNQVKFDPPHWNQVNLDHPHQKPSKFSCSSYKQVIFGQHTSDKSISTTHTTTKSISCLHWNQVKFDPPDGYQVYFDHHKYKVNFRHHTKKSNFRSTHKNKVNFDPRTKNMSSSILTLNQANFNPPLKANLNLTPTLKSSGRTSLRSIPLVRSTFSCLCRS